MKSARGALATVRLVVEPVCESPHAAELDIDVFLAAAPPVVLAYALFVVVVVLASAPDVAIFVVAVA